MYFECSLFLSLNRSFAVGVCFHFSSNSFTILKHLSNHFSSHLCGKLCSISFLSFPSDCCFYYYYYYFNYFSFLSVVMLSFFSLFFFCFYNRTVIHYYSPPFFFLCSVFVVRFCFSIYFHGIFLCWFLRCCFFFLLSFIFNL